MYETLFQKIEASPFKNTYWFARYLLNTDQYGSLGKNREKQLITLTTALEDILLIDSRISESDKLKVLKDTLFRELLIWMKARFICAVPRMWA